jgi:hypothetical protein
MPSRRLGSCNDAEDLKRHEFFKDIDWSAVKGKTYKPPVIPQLKDTEDVRYFAENFTMQKPEDLPAKRLMQTNAKDYFRGRAFNFQVVFIR